MQGSRTDKNPQAAGRNSSRLRQGMRRCINSPLGQRGKLPIKQALGGLGFELVSTRHGARAHLASCLSRFEIATALDVGANRGQHGVLLRSLGFTGEMVSVEPLSDAYAALAATAERDPRWTTHRCALGPAESVETLHVSMNSTSSSLLEVNALHVETEPTTVVVRTEQVSVRTLDSLVAEAAPTGPYFVKIDVQGGEAGVLQGARATIAQTALILVELSLRDLYEGSSDWVEVVSLLRHHGLTPIGIEPAFADPVTGDLLQVDLLAARTARP